MPPVPPWPDPSQSLALGLARVHCKHLIFPGPNLRLWLDPPLMGEFRHTGSDHLAHSVPRYPKLSANLLDWLLILKVHPTDLRNRLHNQHPALCPDSLGRIIHISVRGHFWALSHIV